MRLELWTKEQGGRHTPAMDGYRPEFRASTEGHGDVDLGAAVVTAPADNPMLLPGTTIELEITPVDPAAWGNAYAGLVLGVLEGETQVGTATILGS